MQGPRHCAQQEPAPCPSPSVSKGELAARPAPAGHCHVPSPHMPVHTSWAVEQHDHRDPATAQCPWLTVPRPHQPRGQVILL